MSLFSALPMIALFLSCSFGGNTNLEVFETSCNTPSDQNNTFIGKFPVKPIPIAVYGGDESKGAFFSDLEKASISNAAKKWNTFFQKSKGFKIFDIGSPSIIISANAVDPFMQANHSATQWCLQERPKINPDDPESFTAKIMIYKVTNDWPEDMQDAVAVTRPCKNETDSSTGKYASLNNAIIQINFQMYFQNDPKHDLETIALHELGHLLGLDHSCESTNIASSKGVPDCNNSNPSYLSAIMGPFPTTNGKIQNNDQSRANCLY
jgi:hypothetical protein